MPASDDIQLYPPDPDAPAGMASGSLAAGLAPMRVLPAGDGLRSVRCVTLQAYGVIGPGRFALCFRASDGMDHPFASVGVSGGSAYPPMFHPDPLWSVESSEVWARWDGPSAGTGRFRFLWA